MSMRITFAIIVVACLSGCLISEGDWHSTGEHSQSLSLAFSNDQSMDELGAVIESALDQSEPWFETSLVVGEGGDDSHASETTCQEQYGACKTFQVCGPDGALDGQVVKLVCCNAGGCWTEHQHILCGCI